MADKVLQGKCDMAKCPKCRKSLTVTRDFTGGKPHAPGSWEITCGGCRAAHPLISLDIDTQRALATWSTEKGDLQRYAQAKGIAGCLTDEQALAVRLAAPDSSDQPRVMRLVIQALAGAGKTTTLLRIAERKDTLGEKGQYVAFNKGIVEEFKEKSKAYPSVAVNTMHSLAYRACGRPFQERLGERTRWTNAKYSEFLGCEPFEFIEEGHRFRYGPAQIGELAKLTVQAFWQSSDSAIGRQHVLPHVSFKVASEENRDELVKVVIPHAERLWTDLTDPMGDAPYSASVYLKQWQLGDPVIPVDYMLFDEAQDADDVMIDIISKQADRGVQLIVCGDPFQQLYEWRGANNALRKIDADERVNLSMSFRFGDAIALEANEVLARLSALEGANPPYRVIGMPGMKSAVGPAADPAVILCRSNAGAMWNLMALKDTPKKVALAADKDYLSKILSGLRTLKDGARSRHPELRDFASWDELIEWVEENKRAAGELGTLVSLAKIYSPGSLKYAVDHTVAEEQADVLISTVHKAKGREWSSVQVYKDFPHLDDPDADSLEELRILYVAMTRARHLLDLDIWRAVSPSPIKDARDRFIGPIPRMVVGKKSEREKSEEDKAPEVD